MNILLLDDDPLMLRVLSAQLRSLGLDSPLLCERGEDALALLAGAEPIELVFCDLQMPEMDGVEFVRNLVKLSRAPALVFVSGEDERVLQSVQRLARAHRLDVLGTLHKPVSQAMLRDVLESHHSFARDITLTDMKPVYSTEDLRRGMASGELVNHYQPKVALETGRVDGVETLVRWQHPRDGLVYPDRFISVAEESDLIDRLTSVVLAGALSQARRWRDDGIELNVAVNVSMGNLASLDFPDMVSEAIAAAGIPATCLVLEVTESRLMSDVRMPLDILTRLRLKRVDLSIDDFGMGFSSLSQLRDLPFNELKVDRGFVHGSATDPSLQALVQNSLRLAGQLGMRTVAEGIEDRADWNFLAAAGCDLGQGYFISKPMPGEAMADWMDKWHSRALELGLESR